MARTVLVVDDEPDIRDLVGMWLRDDPRCADVTEADDPDMALRAALRDRPDAVLLDLFLGRRLSVEVIPRIRAACPQTVILVYTGSRRAALDARALEAGADAVVEKASLPVEAVVEMLLSEETPGCPAA